MRTIHAIRVKSVWLIITLMMAFIFVLTACGTNGTNTTTGGGNVAPTPTTSMMKGYGTQHGCPSDTIVQPPATAPNVIVRATDTHKVVTAHTGDIIEFELPFGQMWSGPTTSQPTLQLQSPSGYAMPTNHVCIWRFAAHSAGKSEVTFMGKAICQQGQMCPQYIVNMPFT
ncbi:MAG: hypothetical protein H0W02_20035, partial [Ktedonobacteraceae bacterium]|nr:hypothetical protein [Ktedonobacteraceae bacterium]